VSSSLTFSRNLTGHQGVMHNSEKKIAFQLNLMEALLVNDMNNDIGLAAGLIEALVTLLKMQETQRVGGALPGLRAFVKFSLRCLTSAIRTEPSVARVSTHL
jgi:hypothetical protein